MRMFICFAIIVYGDRAGITLSGAMTILFIAGFACSALQDINELTTKKGPR